jgi:hypothetical protein
MDELFQIIGRLYADIYHSQKLLENFQDQIKIKDNEIANLKSQLINNSENIQDKLS